MKLAQDNKNKNNENKNESPFKDKNDDFFKLFEDDHSWLCPISQEPIEERVIDPHGHAFERKEIENALGHATVCPISRGPLQRDQLYPDLSYAGMVELLYRSDYYKERKKFKEEWGKYKQQKDAKIEALKADFVASSQRADDALQAAHKQSQRWMKIAVGSSMLTLAAGMAALYAFSRTTNTETSSPPLFSPLPGNSVLSPQPTVENPVEQLAVALGVIAAQLTRSGMTQFVGALKTSLNSEQLTPLMPSLFQWLPTSPFSTVCRESDIAEQICPKEEASSFGALSSAASKPKPKVAKKIQKRSKQTLTQKPTINMVTDQSPEEKRVSVGKQDEMAVRIAQYAQAADKGDAMAQYQLGVRYASGRGVPQNWEKAAIYLRLAADQGGAEAQYAVGDCYAKGTGVSQDWEKAAIYLGLAADQGSSEAQYAVGHCYAKGTGVPQDWKRAVDYYRLAADQGSSEAQYAVGDCYAKGAGVPQNWKRAVDYYRLAADKGSADAQFALGICYAKGTGAPQDWKRAVDYFRLAVVQKHAAAQFGLGVCYAKGDGVSQNWKEAVKYYRLAADQGYVLGELSLGNCLAGGDGVSQNWKEAVKYYRLAADQGNAEAQYNLGVCYAKGDGVSTDQEKAVKYYRLAAAQGNAKAQVELEKYAKIQGVAELASRVGIFKGDVGEKIVVEEPQQRPGLVS